MPKAEKGLMESLEDDIKAAGITPEQIRAYDEGEVNDFTSGDEDEEDDTDEDEDTSGNARDRIAARRAKRPSEDEDGTPQADGDVSRGSDGSAPGSSDGAQKDGKPLQDDDVEPANESAWARHRREMRELAAENKRLKEAPAKPAEEAKPAAAASAPAAPVVAPGASEKVNEAVKKRTIEELGPQPNKDEDFAGHLLWNQERQNIIMEELQNDAKQTRIQNQVRDAFNEIGTLEESYTQKVPDYPDAIEHATKAYSQALKVLNPGVTDAQIQSHVAKEKFALALKCAADGTSLPEVLYDLAIERFGYDPKARKADGDADPNDVDYDTPTPRQVAKPVSKPNLSTIAKNQKRSASPLEGGGTQTARRITIERAAQMTPAELIALSPEDLAYLDSIGF